MKRILPLLIASALAVAAVSAPAFDAVGIILGVRQVVQQVPASGRATVGFKPLTELSATETYKGEEGGLYGAGSNEPPASHLAAAKAAGAKITPLNADGNPASDGSIGFVSISMSNATMEFSLFKELADRDDRKSPRVVIVDCAQGGQAMAQWVDPNARAWIEAAWLRRASARNRFKSRGLSWQMSGPRASSPSTGESSTTTHWPFFGMQGAASPICELRISGAAFTPDTRTVRSILNRTPSKADL